jgi:hypothetical protein
VIVPVLQVALWVALLVADSLVRTSYHVPFILARFWSAPVKIALGSHRLALAVLVQV